MLCQKRQGDGWNVTWGDPEELQPHPLARRPASVPEDSDKGGLSAGVGFGVVLMAWSRTAGLRRRLWHAAGLGGRTSHPQRGGKPIGRTPPRAGAGHRAPGFGGPAAGSLVTPRTAQPVSVTACVIGQEIPSGLLTHFLWDRDVGVGCQTLLGVSGWAPEAGDESGQSCPPVAPPAGGLQATVFPVSGSNPQMQKRRALASGTLT